MHVVAVYGLAGGVEVGSAWAERWAFCVLLKGQRFRCRNCKQVRQLFEVHGCDRIEVIYATAKIIGRRSA